MNLLDLPDVILDRIVDAAPELGKVDNSKAIRLLRKKVRLDWRGPDWGCHVPWNLLAAWFPNLRELDCSSTPALYRLMPIGASVVGLSHIRTLDLSKSSVCSLSGLSSLPSLTEVDLSETKIGDVAELGALSSLKRLSIRATRVRDIAPLPPNLEALDVGMTLISGIRDVARMTRLRSFSCKAVKLDDISELKPLVGLESLDCSHNLDVSDFSPLRELTALTTLDMSFTSLMTVNDIVGLSELRELDVSFSKIRDSELGTILRTLPKIKLLACTAPWPGIDVENMQRESPTLSLSSTVCDSRHLPWKTFIINVESRRQLTI